MKEDQKKTLSDMDQDSSILYATQALNMYSSQIQTIVMQSVGLTQELVSK